MLWGEAHLSVRAYIQSLVGDPETADDLLQEVALAAFTSFASYDPTRPFIGWALGITRHHIHRSWSEKTRQRLVVSDMALIADMAQIAEDADDVAVARRESLRACLDHVQGRSWEILRLHYGEDVGTKEIAERLGIAVGHVRVLMHRIREALRDCIERRQRAEAGGA
jgi:RNA polymerase sigma-70 factor (ECF subfamily)